MPFKSWIIFINCNLLFFLFLSSLLNFLCTLRSYFSDIFRFINFGCIFLIGLAHRLRIEKFSLMIRRSILNIPSTRPAPIFKSCRLESWGKFTFRLWQIVLILKKNIFMNKCRSNSSSNIIDRNSAITLTYMAIFFLLCRHKFEIIILNSHLYKNY